MPPKRPKAPTRPTAYGGDGITTFALPDLRGRVPVHVSNTIALGIAQGEDKHTLTSSEMPMHTHQVSASNATASVSDIGSTTWAVPASPAYNPAGNLVQMSQAAPVPLFAPTPDAQMSPMALNAAGASQPHNNMQPFLAMNYIICLQGEFPPRS